MFSCGKIAGLGRGQAVKASGFDPVIPGSNPGAPATFSPTHSPNIHIFQLLAHLEQCCEFLFKPKRRQAAYHLQRSGLLLGNGGVGAAIASNSAEAQTPKLASAAIFNIIKRPYHQPVTASESCTISSRLHHAYAKQKDRSGDTATVSLSRATISVATPGSMPRARPIARACTITLPSACAFQAQCGPTSARCTPQRPERRSPVQARIA